MQTANATQAECGAPHPIWADAILAAQLMAMSGGKVAGIEIKAGAGPVRDAWLDYFNLIATQAAIRVPADVSAQRLQGGLDMAATLAQAKPIYQKGLLAEDKTLVLAMAERCPAGTAAIIAGGLDANANMRLIALNEATADEDGLPSALADRLDLTIWLDGLSYRQTVLPAERPSLPDQTQVDAVMMSDAMREALILACLKSGLPSMRKPLSLLRVAKAIAAIQGERQVTEEIAATAIRLVCARVLNTEQEEPQPEAKDETPPPPHEPPQNDNNAPDQEADAEFDPELLLNMLIEAAAAQRPDLQALEKPTIEKSRGAAGTGKSGDVQQRARRGKPVGHSARPPFTDARPDVLATLRTAAPWQTVRRKMFGLGPWQPGEKLHIRTEDFRYKKLRQRTESVTIFTVDASGSTALERLAEAKGAIELLLSDCYVRRDSVALIAFRGEKAELILEPTRSLVRAKRALSSLPAGGPTPLASALTQSAMLAAQIKRKSQTPLMVFLTDGKGNIALDGTANRANAQADTMVAARHVAALQAQSVIVDISRRPREAARDLAATMHADYCLLPQADAKAVSKIVTDYLTAK